MAGSLDPQSRDAVAGLVQASRALGSDPRLVLHGGGNSSLKVTWRDVTGTMVPAILVKGSGHNMAHITETGFAPLRLDRIRELLPPTRLGDLEFADELRCATLDSNAPDASVETLVHALLPHTAVLHSHSDAVLAITNTADGAERIAQLYGERVLAVDYAMPGPDLGAAVLAAWESEPHRQSVIDGIIVLEHGLFTMASGPQEALALHLELVALADAYLDERRTPRTERARLETPRPEELARLRRQLSEVAGYSLIMRRRADAQVATFLADQACLVAAGKGPATPDHVIWTGRVPMLGADVDEYIEAYEQYFRDFASRRSVELIARDPAPRIVLDERMGLLALGRTTQEARAADELFCHTMTTITDAQSLGGYEPASAGHVFDLEYWAPQQEKLKRAAPGKPLTGRIALVTGAASGIGRACAAGLLDAGASVVGWDISDSVVSTFDSPEWLGLRIDVTDHDAQVAAISAGVEAFGGLDIVVVSAGIFPTAQHLTEMDMGMWRRTMSINVDSVAELFGQVQPLLELSPGGGRVVVIASKNVAAPGPGAAAYSASKAALTQLARVAALEWAADGIRVNMVHPDAVFDTALWTTELLAKRAEHYGMSVEEYKRRNLLGTEVTSAAVGRLVTAMSGELFDATTGAQVPIDGGNERVI